MPITTSSSTKVNARLDKVENRSDSLRDMKSPAKAFPRPLILILIGFTELQAKSGRVIPPQWIVKTTTLIHLAHSLRTTNGVPEQFAADAEWTRRMRVAFPPPLRGPHHRVCSLQALKSQRSARHIQGASTSITQGSIARSKLLRQGL
jgi:hypothetical protein